MALPPPTEVELETASPAELLVLAAELGRTDLVVSALRSGASVSELVPSRSGDVSRTALHTALSYGNLDAARALLAAGALLSTKDSSGATPASLAAGNEELEGALSTHVCQRAAAGDVATIRDAASAGIDLSRHDGSSAHNTALHWAASFGQAEVVNALLKAGAAPDPVNGKGHTALRDAAAAAHLPIVRALIAAGADPGKVDNEGKTPADVAANDEVLGALHRRADVLVESPALSVTDAVAAAPPVVTPRTPYFVPGERAAPPALSIEMPEWGALLWPRPQRFVEALPLSSFTVPPVVTISAENSCMGVARQLLAWLAVPGVLPESEYSMRLVGGGQGGLGEAIGFSAVIFLRVDDYGMERSEQAYSLTVRDFGIDVVGSDLSGLFYGCGTLLKLLKLRRTQATDTSTPMTIPTCSIRDWPSVRRRGLYLDLSSRRLLKLQSLEKLIVFLAVQMKLNQLQLKLGANFQRLETSAGNGRAALRHEELLELNSVCKRHYVELIPVTGLPDMPTLADIQTENGGTERSQREDAQKKYILEREMLYDEFLPLFDTEQVNLEELSHQPSCDFADFERLRSAAKSLRSRGKTTIQVFGNKMKDVLADSAMKSGVLAELPARSIMILEAEGFERGKFAEACLQLRQYGLAFYTCSSSCTEGSIAGRTSTGVENSQKSIRTALDQGAAGVLLKDLSACSNGAPIVFLYQALVPFGGLSWNAKCSIGVGPSGADDVLSHLYDMYIFNDPVEKGILGGVALSLGDLHRVAGDISGTALFHLLGHRREEADLAMEKMSYLGLRRALKRADRIENALSSYDGNADDSDVEELRACAILLGVSARLGASLFSISSATSMDSNRSIPEGGVDIAALPDGRRSDLCNAMLQAIELLRTAWMERYYEHGFAETVESIVGETISKLAQGMPFQRYLDERKAEGWATTDDL